MDYTHHISSPLGGITLASDGSAIVGLWFDHQKYFGSTLGEPHEEKALPIFEEADHWLDVYFSGRAPDFTPKLRMRTTAFRRAVWEILLTIPFGHTMTYGQIADRLKATLGLNQMSAQAVGGAVGHNAVSLIIPCHRVVGADGSLTGYAGGLDRKVRLLRLEQADMSRLYLPKKS
ncbi:MAG: methylated-DNA--[Oscillospiraceae bacterium]|nr:methylated-DNA--[protein]-cysteine S-methyltransferase [Oscillospiraceae bacterium]